MPTWTRGDVVVVNLDPALGSEPNKKRPCVVVQNDTGNKFSPVTIVAAITDAEKVPRRYPVDVPVGQGEGGLAEGGLAKDSVVQCNMLRCVDGQRVLSTLGKVSPRTMQEVDRALKISLALA
jgi:mRNA interferase MazF